MPHCIIEHASNISPEPLLKAVYQGALVSGLFDANDIKVRSTCFEHYQSGAERFDFCTCGFKDIGRPKHRAKVILV